MRTTSAGQSPSLRARLREEFQRLLILWRHRPDPAQLIESAKNDLACYAAVLKKYGGLEMSEARILEIGHGQRPVRALALLACGYDVWGIDLDAIVLRGSFGEFARVLATNGIERFAKTLVRYAIRDRHENVRIARLLGSDYDRLARLASRRLVQGNACDPKCWPKGEWDLIYSEDVFEHISKEQLRRLCLLIAKRLSARGIAVIRPMVWTGILGGHQLEWYASDSLEGRKNPWGHLLGSWSPPNTYLNKLRRREYREMFEEVGLEVLVDEACHPDLGRPYLTDELRRRLADLGYDDYEIFSNKVTFVVRKAQ